ncbi:MAG TPA: putative porin [Steroidobacteraceae bacterium]|nr:putative porin [Steroidobacteraceae bacterium]
MKFIYKSVLALAVGAACCAPVYADGKSDQEVDELRDTLTGVLQALVEKGLLTREQAQAIVADAQTKAEAAAQARAKAQAAQDEKEKDAIHVTYVPQIVRDEISRQVAKEVTPTVTGNVIDEAKKDRWGIPGALPPWVNNFNFYGDMRFRVENDHFAKDNQQNTYLNYNAVNSAGGISKAGANAYLNTTEDRLRARIRLRLGIDAKITDGITAGIRLATGSLTEPVSTNQTLGQSGNRYQFAVDQAYLRYDATGRKLPWMTLTLGRMPNPFVSTDLVWDPDVQFEGMAATWRYALGGMSMPSHVFLTAGAFPLQEIELSSKDKWLYGGQLGFNMPWDNGGKMVIAGSYYSFSNITGKLNAPNSTLLNYTAPQYMQKGNTTFDILNDTDNSTNLFALAPEYREVNITALVDIPAFSHLLSVTADYVTNVGYDRNKVLAQSGFASVDQVTDPVGKLAFDKMVNGYQVGFAFGTVQSGKRGTWRTAINYKYLERDAVVDALTDSDFHLGGTAAKGYILQGDWWFRDRNWLTVKYISSDEIKHTGPVYLDAQGNATVPNDTPRFGVDTFMFDVNGQF